MREAEFATSEYLPAYRFIRGLLRAPARTESPSSSEEADESELTQVR